MTDTTAWLSSASPANYKWCIAHPQSAWMPGSVLHSLSLRRRPDWIEVKGRGADLLTIASMIVPRLPDRYTAQQALDRLKEGNARFVRGEARFPTVQKEVLAALAKEQHPFATILGCSDSRVPPELIFDAGFGELFVIRVAGNVLGTEILGTLQYAGRHLQTPLFVVLGHEACGAVTAAVDSLFHGAKLESRIEALLADIIPGLVELDRALPREALLHAAVEANVRHTMRQLLEMPEVQERLAAGEVRLVGGVYELESGRVRFLE